MIDWYIHKVKLSSFIIIGNSLLRPICSGCIGPMSVTVILKMTAIAKHKYIAISAMAYEQFCGDCQW